MANPREIRCEVEEQIEVIYEALENIKGQLRQLPDRSILTRAESYWLAHIDGALLNRGGYLGGSFIPASETLEELEGARGSDDGEEL